MIRANFTRLIFRGKKRLKPALARPEKKIFTET
jgi:hypothetical protein